MLWSGLRLLGHLASFSEDYSYGEVVFVDRSAFLVCRPSKQKKTLTAHHQGVQLGLLARPQRAPKSLQTIVMSVS